MTFREQLNHKLNPLGLMVLAVTSDRENKSIFLIGSAGRSISYLFEQDEFSSPQKDPLDQWSKACLDPIGDIVGAKVVYPFDGPPFLPFIRWGVESKELFQSPLGLLIHPQYGLWLSLRGALILNDVEPSFQGNAISPCESCLPKKCLTQCAAFSAVGFEPNLCRDSFEENDCINQGCKARLACPVGFAHHYQPKQIKFHMEALAKLTRQLDT